jgi:hypothetical protein
MLNSTVFNLFTPSQRSIAATKYSPAETQRKDGFYSANSALSAGHPALRTTRLKLASTLYLCLRPQP